MAGLTEAPLDRFDLLAARGLQRQLDGRLAETNAAEGAVVRDVEDVGARLRHEGGEAGEGPRSVAQHDHEAHEPSVLHETALDDPGNDVDVDVSSPQHEGRGAPPEIDAPIHEGGPGPGPRALRHGRP